MGFKRCRVDGDGEGVQGGHDKDRPASLQRSMPECGGDAALEVVSRGGSSCSDDEESVQHTYADASGVSDGDAEDAEMESRGEGGLSGSMQPFSDMRHSDVGPSLSEALRHDLKRNPMLSSAAGVAAQSSTSGKAASCCICGEAALYTCPGCSRRTCSITCVRVHKNDFSCSGVRDVAVQVPLSDFTDSQLQRDYRFLEDCRRVIDNAERHFPHSNWRYTFKTLPPPLRALREAARRRGVVCQITSEGLEKREKNTSRFDRRSNTIIWRCSFHFKDPRGEEYSFDVSTDWASERHRLSDILRYCWSTNPPLLSYHINQRYNRAGPRVRAAAAKEPEERAAEAEAEIPHEGEDDEDTMTPLQASRAAPSVSPLLSPGPAVVPLPSMKALAPLHDAVELTPLPILTATEEVPAVPPIEPLNATEVHQRQLVESFLAQERVVVLAMAERLPGVVKYFQLDLHETLNENLRQMFFISEHPVLTVIHRSALAAYPLVEAADIGLIRDSFRSKSSPSEKKTVVVKKKSEMSAEEAERLSHVPCRRFLNGRCTTAEDCPYWHCTPEEIPACRSFVRNGCCDKGPRCSFRHDEEAVRAARKRHRSSQLDDGGGRGGRGSCRGGRDTRLWRGRGGRGGGNDRHR